MTSDQAVGALGVVVVALVGGGAWFSVRSAVVGPRWALGRTRAMMVGGWGLSALGIAATGLDAPPWLAAALVYVGVMVVLLAWVLRRILTRVAEVGGLDEIDPVVRLKVIRRARTGLMVAAILSGVAAAALAGVASHMLAGIAVVLALNWLGLGVSGGGRTGAPTVDG